MENLVVEAEVILKGHIGSGVDHRLGAACHQHRVAVGRQAAGDVEEVWSSQLNASGDKLKPLLPVSFLCNGQLQGVTGTGEAVA